MAQATKTSSTTLFDSVLKIALLVLFAAAAIIFVVGAVQATDAIATIVLFALAGFIGWMTYMLKKEMFR